MRKTLLAIAAVAALSTPALAQPNDPNTTAAEFGTGAVAGTVFGLGVSEGWWGTSIAGATLPTTVAGAATLGGVAGVGTVALLDASIQHCRGFQALLGLNKGACVNGEFVGYGPPPAPRRHYYR